MSSHADWKLPIAPPKPEKLLEVEVTGSSNGMEVDLLEHEMAR
jgi:hypothetical protein